MDSARCDCPCCHPIPGADPGVCPDCGGWRMAGCTHDCEAERKRVEDEVNHLVDLWKEENGV